MLDARALEALRGKKNLLAFSAGVDSTALFFLLREADVNFDIALVNYNTRTNSDAEEAYAKELAAKYGKECFTLSVKLEKNDFENEARKSRYAFFENSIKEHRYQNLITAHQLNDKLEWFFMRLSRGGGVKELFGMGYDDDRSFYRIVRPLLKTQKKELYEYLTKHKIKFFEDESNDDTAFERNFFRHNFANSFLEKFGDGVARSFDILEQEAAIFEENFFVFDSIIVFKSISKIVDESNAANALKRIGYLPSMAQRDEISSGFDCVVGGAFCVAKNEDGYIFVAPYVKTVMQKDFKEECRIAKLPPKIRGYLATKEVNPLELAKQIDYFFGSLGGLT